MGGSLPFRSGVVVSLRPLSACLGSLWLVTAPFPSLSLYLQYPSSPGFICCFTGCLGCATLLYLWLCALLRLGMGFLMLPACLSPSIGLLVYWFQWLLFSTGVTYLRDGATPVGSRLGCPRSERRFSLPIWVRYTGQFLVGPPTSVCGYLLALSLWVCCQVVLAVSRNFGCP